MLGSLATFGYVDKTTLWELQAAMRANPHALIIDTRLDPYCHWSRTWERQTLRAEWKHRYVWRGDWLGNIHHKQREKPIQLANEEQGIAWLVRGLEKGYTLLLLCACVDYEKCHRKVIYEKVKAQLGDRLPEYRPSQRVLTPCGLGVIDPSIPLDVHRARNRYAVLFDIPQRQRYFFPSELQPFDVTQQTLVA